MTRVKLFQPKGADACVVWMLPSAKAWAALPVWSTCQPAACTYPSGTALVFTSDWESAEPVRHTARCQALSGAGDMETRSLPAGLLKLLSAPPLASPVHLSIGPVASDGACCFPSTPPHPFSVPTPPHPTPCLYPTRLLFPYNPEPACEVASYTWRGFESFN